MPLSTKRLTVADFVLNRTGSFAVQVVGAVFGIALTVFFRRIETVNADVVPEDVGVIFVMNHPNGLIDPALVFVALPRRISFLAKSTLFKMPVISFLLKTVEALPWGSRSISSTFIPVAARAVARLIAVVVLPTPPFWLATAIRIIFSPWLCG
jgi:1-acyl-sn-glycerol-3-phosphate acyltransferase